MGQNHLQETTSLNLSDKLVKIASSAGPNGRYRATQHRNATRINRNETVMAICHIGWGNVYGT